jgi:hypothetical protein
MGVTTMKMISNTSITSTMGVTLMSELTLAPSFRFANAIEFLSCWFQRRQGLLSRGGSSAGLDRRCLGNS